MSGHYHCIDDSKKQAMTAHVQRADGFVEPRKVHRVFSSVPPSKQTR